MDPLRCPHKGKGITREKEMKKKTALQTRSSQLFGKRGERWIGGESKEGSEAEKKKEKKPQRTWNEATQNEFRLKMFVNMVWRYNYTIKIRRLLNNRYFNIKLENESNYDATHSSQGMPKEWFYFVFRNYINYFRTT